MITICKSIWNNTKQNKMNTTPVQPTNSKHITQTSNQPRQQTQQFLTLFRAQITSPPQILVNTWVLQNALKVMSHRVSKWRTLLNAPSLLKWGGRSLRASLVCTSSDITQEEKKTRGRKALGFLRHLGSASTKISAPTVQVHMAVGEKFAFYLLFV